MKTALMEMLDFLEKLVDLVEFDSKRIGELERRATKAELSIGLLEEQVRSGE